MSGANDTFSGSANHAAAPGRMVTFAMACMAAIAFVVSVMLGPDGLGVSWHDDASALIFCEIRLPRAILGFLSGAALGLSGAVLQGYLRNPLAEPSLLGISGGAALGAVVAIHSGLAATVSLALPVLGLIGAATAALMIFALAGLQGSTATLILAGVAVSSLTSALTALALNLSPNPFAASEIMFWLMGSLTDRSLVHVAISGPLIVAGAVLLLLTGRDLEALSLGEDAARNLGMSPRRLQLKVIGGTALAVGAATAVTGALAFVGLMVPHLLRPFVQGSPSRLLLPSLFGGAVFVLLADVLLRVLAPYGDMRLGVVTAIIGAPFFLWLVVRSRQDLMP